MDSTKKIVTIEDLPEEVLEYILSLISPYKDLHECMRVSKLWRRCVQNVVRIKQRNFLKAINDFDIKWNKAEDKAAQEVPSPLISKRYSHSAVVCDNCMYVFGGCTSAMTTFNDLWKLDLSTRTWIRPLTTGNYPSPKASSSFVRYENSLVLFGGWTYPPSYPMYQSWHLFDELHIYDITTSSWKSSCTINTPPPTAGHSASIVGDFMIVFGGLQKPSTVVHCEKSNQVWKLNLKDWTWQEQRVIGPKPNARFGHTQVTLDDKNLLILGGSGGPTHQYSDCWLLNMEGRSWTWVKVELEGKENAPSNIWSNPGCKIGDKIVILNRVKQEKDMPIVYYPRSQWAKVPSEDARKKRIDLASRKLDRDENVNGQRGEFRNVRRANPNHLAANNIDYDDDEDVQLRIPGPLMNSFMQPPALHNENVVNKIQNAAEACKLPSVYPPNRNPFLDSCYKIKRRKNSNYLGLYVLDISETMTGLGAATWLPPRNVQEGPDETILYSLVYGKSELIMFGGILKDGGTLAQCSLYSQISNSVYFITAPNYVI
ncbi:F-box only protein 42-like isoform X1 [Euwallacea fornicatus]|uniref:F-box only protein 42-like isoform X1 n=1 Tax=Euwallacea fornicatus TaxID=995702 RepID=UPI00338D6517